jgi:glyoxylase-like metal-dependent hydrolase (beta-lactamase superfamily II)
MQALRCGAVRLVLGFSLCACVREAPFRSAEGSTRTETATRGPSDTSALASIRFFDVGQGDAALISTRNGSQVLVDAGPSGSGVATRIRQLGIDTLDLVVASHPHADHIGGMAGVLDSLVVLAYMDNGAPHTSATFRLVLDRLLIRRASGSLRYLRGDTTRRLILADSVELRVLPGKLDRD